MSTSIRRRLPPELLSEMHKYLPLADAIHVLVNVPSQAIYLNNAPRMRRTIQRIKTSLNEYIDTLSLEWENYREELEIYKNVEWKPQLSALLLYGAWLTTSRQFYMEEMDGCRIVGMPENFIGELLLHLTNSWGIPKDGRFINIDNNKLHILSAKNAKPEMRLSEGSSGRQLIFGGFEFTLANLPTNGEYLFDVGVQFGGDMFFVIQIAGIKIRKRKNDDNIELKCIDQIELGKKSEEANDHLEED